jgi:hypothetical protein
MCTSKENILSNMKNICYKKFFSKSITPLVLAVGMGKRTNLVSGQIIETFVSLILFLRKNVHAEAKKNFLKSTEKRIK